MLSLGHQQLTIMSPDHPLESGWISIVDSLQHFTVSFPPTWEWLEQHNRQQEPDFDDIIDSNDQFRAVVSLLEDNVFDMEILAIARDTRTLEQGETQGFLIVARDNRSIPLSPEEARRRLLQGEAGVLGATMSDLNGDLPSGVFLIELLHQRHKYRCQQKLIQGSQGTYLISGCAQTTQFAAYQQNLRAIVSSFQLLSP